MVDQTLRFAEPGPVPHVAEELTYSPLTGLCLNNYVQARTTQGQVRKWYAVDDAELLEALLRYRARRDVTELTIRRDGVVRTYRRR